MLEYEHRINCCLTEKISTLMTGIRSLHCHFFDFAFPASPSGLPKPSFVEFKLQAQSFIIIIVPKKHIISGTDCVG